MNPSNTLDKPPITAAELFPVGDIDFDKRYRTDYGDLASFKDSLMRYGVIQPPTLADDNKLVDGGRRCLALYSLWTDDKKCPRNCRISDDKTQLLIPVFRQGQIPESMRREMELIAQVQHKDFEWHEEVKAVCTIHYTREREAATTGSKWSMELTGEVLGGYGKSYVWNCLQLAAVDIKSDAYKDCKNITDAVRKMLQAKEDVAMRVAAERTQLTRTVVPAIQADGTVKAPVGQPQTTEGLLADLTGKATAPVEKVIDLSSMLFQGDSVYDILPKWPDACVDHIITDPPYGIDMSNLDQQNAGMDTTRVDGTHKVEDNMAMFPFMFKQAYRVLKDTGYFIIWADYDQWNYLQCLAIETHFAVQRWPITWCKTSTCKNQSAHVNTTKNTEIAMVCRKGQARLPAPVGTSFINASNDFQKLSNPFAKPFEVWKFLIDSFTITGQAILDPFAGEGTGPVAALRLGRRALAIEKDPVHWPYLVDSTKKYWQSIFGEKNVRFV